MRTSARHGGACDAVRGSKKSKSLTEKQPKFSETAQATSVMFEDWTFSP